MRVAPQRHGGVMPRGEYRCRPAHRVQEELLPPPSREEKRPQQPSDERSPAPPRGTCKLDRHKDAGDALLHAWRPLHPSQWQSHPVAPHAAAGAHSLRPPSRLSLFLRTHRWTWHTHRHVRNHLFFLFRCTSHSSTAKRMPLLLSRIPLRHASRHMHQPTATQSVNATQPPRMMPPHTPTRHHATRRKQCLDTQNRLPQRTTAPSRQ
ncbi:hypothetical protein TcCL_Unassigned02445 [Trypanosoma cruzi]|nr:hypothetical protein TcCL_Unassigned02445 [Trypanosoma cruzi]